MHHYYSGIFYRSLYILLFFVFANNSVELSPDSHKAARGHSRISPLYSYIRRTDETRLYKAGERVLIFLFFTSSQKVAVLITSKEKNVDYTFLSAVGTCNATQLLNNHLFTVFSWERGINKAPKKDNQVNPFACSLSLTMLFYFKSVFIYLFTLSLWPVVQT